MPLRVAEVNGWLTAVNGCADCPYQGIKNNDPFFLICEHRNIRQTTNEFRLIYRNCIPIWCPLPNPKIDTEPTILKENIDSWKKLMQWFAGDNILIPPADGIITKAMLDNWVKSVVELIKGKKRKP